MTRRFLAALLLAWIPAAMGNPSSPEANGFPPGPDGILLRDGTEVRGLIIKNTAGEVVLAGEDGEIAFPKSKIVRIRDKEHGDALSIGIREPGRLPPMDSIINDFRSNDSILSFVQIPAARIDEGRLRQIPYRSFRVNRSAELNIYGQPNSPVAIEIGLFGGVKNRTRHRALLRSYLAGYLNSREEIAAFYSMSLDGGSASAGRLSMEVVPRRRRAPAEHGGYPSTKTTRSMRPASPRRNTPPAQSPPMKCVNAAAATPKNPSRAACSSNKNISPPRPAAFSRARKQALAPSDALAEMPPTSSSASSATATEIFA